MKRLLALVLLALLPCTLVLADMDMELEKREAVKREAAKRAEEAKQREMQRLKKETETKANATMNKHLTDQKRKALGASATGKSDSEVDRLYDAKMKDDMENAGRTVESSRNALSHGQGADALKGVTGKSLKEMENMSDAEAEALAREMEKKYGK
jgi:uncharacterized protein YpuA (DUF1002 family)